MSGDQMFVLVAYLAVRTACAFGIFLQKRDVDMASPTEIAAQIERWRQHAEKLASNGAAHAQEAAEIKALLGGKS